MSVPFPAKVKRCESDGTEGFAPIASIPMSVTEMVVTVTPLSLITLMIILGNFLVILAFVLRSNLRTPPNAYLVSLAFVDMCVGIFILPLNILLHLQNGAWEFGVTLCHFWITADVALCSLSIFHLIAIAVDRYRSVMDGINYIQQRSFQAVISTIVGMWVLALWISSPPVLGWNDWDPTENKVCRLSGSRGYVFHSTLGCFVFPIFLMLVVYRKIYLELQKKFNERAKMPSLEQSMDCDVSDTDIDICDKRQSQSVEERRRTWQMALTKNTLSRSIGTGTTMSAQMTEFLNKRIKFSLTRERRAAKTLGIIVGAFIVCWVPFSVLYLVSAMLPCHMKLGETTAFQVCAWLGYSNSAINPIIYTIFNTQFRNAFKKVLKIS